MMTIRELQTQLVNVYGIESEWLESGGGQWCLSVQVGTASQHGEWLEIGSLEFDLVNEYDIPVHTFSATLVDNGDTDLYSDSIPGHAMAKNIANEILKRN